MPKEANNNDGGMGRLESQLSLKMLQLSSSTIGINKNWTYERITRLTNTLGNHYESKKLVNRIRCYKKRHNNYYKNNNGNANKHLKTVSSLSASLFSEEHFHKTK